MDDSQFDALTKRLATGGTSRRRFLRRLGTVAGLVVLGGGGRATLAAQSADQPVEGDPCSACGFTCPSPNCPWTCCGLKEPAPCAGDLRSCLAQVRTDFATARQGCEAGPRAERATCLGAASASLQAAASACEAAFAACR